MLVLIADKRY